MLASFLAFWSHCRWLDNDRIQLGLILPSLLQHLSVDTIATITRKPKLNGLLGAVEDARFREVDGIVLGEAVFDGDDDEGRRKKGYYERVKFEVEDSLIAFCGLLKDVTVQRGTFVWDDERRIGLWEVRVLDSGGGGKGDVDSWARKVVRFRRDGEGTRIEEFVEGYSRESVRILEGLTKRFTRNLHKNWMKRYTDIWND